MRRLLCTKRLLEEHLHGNMVMTRLRNILTDSTFSTCTQITIVQWEYGLCWDMNFNLFLQFLLRVLVLEVPL